MVKIIYLLILVTVISYGSQGFEDACAKCHRAKDLPNEVIYKRYLLKYSSNQKIKEAIAHYLKNPKVENTIMPAQFITIFGLKEASTLSDDVLNNYVDEFINRYDIKRKITLQEK